MYSVVNTWLPTRMRKSYRTVSYELTTVSQTQAVGVVCTFFSISSRVPGVKPCSACALCGVRRAAKSAAIWSDRIVHPVRKWMVNAREELPILQHRFVLLHQLALHFAEHLLVIGAGLPHLIRISLEDDAHLIVNAIFKRHLVRSVCVGLLGHRPYVFGLNELASNQFLGKLPGRVGHIFFRKQHDVV